MPKRSGRLEVRGKHFIKEWRKEKGYTQDDVAEAIGSSAANISRIEVGKQSYTQDILERIAKFLHVSPADLIGTDPFSEEDVAADATTDDSIRIAEARKVSGLTQTQLAERVGTSRSQIVKLERGERRITIDWLRRIAAALDVDVHNLLGHGPIRTIASPKFTVMIDQSVIREAEIIVAKAGPINASPHDIVREIFVGLMGFRIDDEDV